jgi:hypothetical protein
MDLNMIQRISLTPTDVVNIMGLYKPADKAGASYALEIICKMLNRNNMTEVIFAAILDKIKKCILNSLVYYEDGKHVNHKGEFLHSMLMNTNLYDLHIAIKKDIVPVGAPGHTYIQKIANELGANIIFNKDADVANAVGAAVAKIHKMNSIIVRYSRGHKSFLVHSSKCKEMFFDLEDAIASAKKQGNEIMSEYMKKQNCLEFEIKQTQKNIMMKDGTFIQSTVETYGYANPL